MSKDFFLQDDVIKKKEYIKKTSFKLLSLLKKLIIVNLILLFACFIYSAFVFFNINQDLNLIEKNILFSSKDSFGLYKFNYHFYLLTLLIAIVSVVFFKIFSIFLTIKDKFKNLTVIKFGILIIFIFFTFIILSYILQVGLSINYNSSDINDSIFFKNSKFRYLTNLNDKRSNHIAFIGYLVSVNNSKPSENLISFKTFAAYWVFVSIYILLFIFFIAFFAVYIISNIIFKKAYESYFLSHNKNKKHQQLKNNKNLNSNNSGINNKDRIIKPDLKTNKLILDNKKANTEKIISNINIIDDIEQEIDFVNHDAKNSFKNEIILDSNSDLNKNNEIDLPTIKIPNSYFDNKKDFNKQKTQKILDKYQDNFNGKNSFDNETQKINISEDINVNFIPSYQFKNHIGSKKERIEKILETAKIDNNIFFKKDKKLDEITNKRLENVKKYSIDKVKLSKINDTNTKLIDDKFKKLEKPKTQLIVFKQIDSIIKDVKNEKNNTSYIDNEIKERLKKIK